MITHNQLEQFGLNSKEGKVYIASLELGTDTAQNVAKKAGIHRVSTYDIIESLTKKGLMSQIIKEKKRYFVPVDPELFLDSLKRKEQLFTNLLPQLKAIQEKGGKKPKVMYFEGEEAMLNAYFDRIRHISEDQENLVYGSSERIVADYPEMYKKFTQERLRKKIKAKIIVEKSESGLKEKETGEKHLRLVKFWPQGKKFIVNTVIYGDRVMIVSWKNMMITIIEDKNYADSQRVLFEMLWQYLP